MVEKENNLPQKKNSNRKTVLLSIVMALLVCLSFIGGYFTSELSAPKKVRDVEQIISLIEQYGYILNPETGEVYDFTEEDYADVIVKELLDQYCEYYTAEERTSSLQKGLGIYSGIGLTISEDSLAVFKVIGNSPADLAGIKKGDVMIAGITPVGERVDFSTAQDALDFIDSQENSDTVTLIFDGKDERVVLEKQEYFVSYVTYYDSEQRFCFRTEDTQFSEPSNEMSAILDDDTAYIKFDQFEGSAALQLGIALTHMEERGRTKLILDLRDNGGGYMTVLTDVAGMLIKNGNKNNTLVAVSRGKTGEEEFRTNLNMFNDNIQAISVIANEYTASASECLIGAMLHYGDFFSKDRLIIERDKGIARTYGKGIMQSTFPLADGAAIKITTANILWPDGTTCIHGKGITTTAENSVEKGVGAILRAQATLN